MPGYDLPLIGKLLRHRQRSTTAGYAHLGDIHLVETADKVGKHYRCGHEASYRAVASASPRSSSEWSLDLN